MSKVKSTDILALIFSLAPFAVWAIIAESLPERLPIHWNIQGEPDGWTSKGQIPVFLGLMTAIGISVYLVLRFIKHIDPKRTAVLNERIATKIGLGIVVFNSLVNILILFSNTSSFNVTSAVLLMVSLLFTFLGNVMYNIKPNYFIGIRLPWTLENEDNWKSTHRLAGMIWFIGGFVCAILALIVDPKTMFIIFLSTIGLLVLIPSVYSIILFRRSKQQA